MSPLLVLFVLLSQIASADEPMPRQPPVRFGPCGVYDIAELADHFLVRVDQRPDDFNPGSITIRIALIDPQPPGDLRQPLPIEELALVVRDEDKRTIASSPLQWAMVRDPLGGKQEQATTFTVSPSAAKQVIVTRQWSLRAIDQPHLLISFASLAKDKQAK